VSGLETPSFVAHNGAVMQGFFLTDRAARFRDLGPGYFASRIDKDRKTRNNIRPLNALGYTVPYAPGRLTAAQSSSDTLRRMLPRCRSGLRRFTG